jgi:RNA polymerase primary sigma factor
MLQALNERGRKIRIPSNQLSVSNKIRDARLTILQTEERAATVSELAEMTGISEDAIKRSDKLSKRCSSLDAQVSDDSDTTMVELMEDTQTRRPDFTLAVRESQREEVQQLLTQLKPREAAVVSMYYGIGRKYPSTLNDISDVLGISRERIRQIRDKSVLKLRRRYGSAMQATFAN